MKRATPAPAIPRTPRPPYTKAGKCTFAGAKDKAGVYLIRENGKIVYVGRSATNLYKTLYRHFQTWKHPEQAVTSYKGRRHSYSVQVAILTPARAKTAEAALIRKHKPRDNRAMPYQKLRANTSLVDLFSPPSKPSEKVPF